MRKLRILFAATGVLLAACFVYAIVAGGREPGGAAGLSAIEALREGRAGSELKLELDRFGRQDRAVLARLRADEPSARRAEAHRAGGRPVGDPGVEGPQVRQHSTRRTGVEPTVGLTSDGTIFYLGVDRTPAGSLRTALLRSRDRGQSFQELDLLVRGQKDDTATTDPFVYVDKRTDRVFNADLTLPCSFVSFSDDQGESFRTGNICEHTDHQTVFAGPPPPGGSRPQGYPNIVYYCAIDQGASVFAASTGCSRSLDGGTTFRRTGAAPYVNDGSRRGGSFGVPGYCGGTVGHGRVDGRGTIYLPRGFCNQPFLAISTNAGDRWKLVQVADIGMDVGPERGAQNLGVENHEARVAIDGEGNVYYMWVARDHLPYVAVSRDGGNTFGKPVMVAAPGVNEAWGPSLDVGGDTGRIAFSYIGTTNSPGPPFCARTTADSCETADGKPPRSAREYEKTAWGGYMGMSTNALDEDPLFFSTTVSDPADPLTRGTCGPVQCQQQIDFLDLTVGPDGTAWATFVDGCTPDPQVACQLPGIGILGELSGGRPSLGRPPEFDQRQSPCTPRSAPRTSYRRGRASFAARRRIAFRGRARDRGCGEGIRRVEVAVARRSRKGPEGTRRRVSCRFVNRKGRLGRSVSCARRRYITARGTDSWLFKLRRTLPRGHYKVWARSVTRSGFVERVSRRNTRTFKVR